MVADDSARDRRTAFRCPVVAARSPCTLQVGESQLPARLLDESTGGFGVLVENPPALSVGQAARLLTDSGWFEVRVTHIAEAAAPEGKKTDGSERPSSWFRLGLLRLGEHMPAARYSRSLLVRSLFSRFSRERPPATPLLIFCSLLTLATVLIWAGWRSFFPGPETSGAERRASSSDADFILPVREPSNGTASKTPSEPRPIDGSGFESRASRDADPSFDPYDVGDSLFGFSGDAAPTPKQSDPNSADDLGDLIGRLTGAASRPLSDMAKGLHLSDRQQAAIHRIVGGTNAEMQSLDREAAAKALDPHQLAGRRDKLLDDCRRQTLDLLTPQQRAQWDKLLDQRQTPAPAQPSANSLSPEHSR